MNSSKNLQDNSDIRRRAEKELEGLPKEPENIAKMSPKEMERLIHELQVHQIELEAQNEELRQAQLDLEAALRDSEAAIYFDAASPQLRAGLILRAVGESHDAAHALGYKVVRIRMAAICSVCSEPFTKHVTQFSSALVELGQASAR